MAPSGYCLQEKQEPAGRPSPPDASPIIATARGSRSSRARAGSHSCRLLGFNGAAWSPFVASLTETNTFPAPQIFASPHNAALKLDIIEQELTLSGASVTSSIAIPNGSICFGVSERVTEAITGASSFKVGISGETAKFGDLLGLSLGSTNFGIIGPTAFYADTPIVVTANGSTFSGGKVRLAIHVLRVAPPES
jgi:hypothetical protein